jgi:hypothetical protein
MAGQLRLTTTKVKADPREQTLVRRFAIALADFHGEELKLRSCEVLKDAKIIEADVMEFFDVEEWEPLGFTVPR